jgi:hypothetical protein
MREAGTISQPLFSPNTMDSPGAVFAFERGCSRRSVASAIEQQQPEPGKRTGNGDDPGWIC